MNGERDTDERLWHPWLRINRLLRAMLHERWSTEAWPQVKAEFKKVLALRNQIRRAGWFNQDRAVMRWGGLEYLKVPQWRTAFEAADVIFGVDVATGREILVFDRGEMQMIAVTGMSDRLRVLRISIDGVGDELELLVAACEAYRGHHDYEAES